MHKSRKSSTSKISLLFIHFSSHMSMNNNNNFGTQTEKRFVSPLYSYCVCGLVHNHGLPPPPPSSRFETSFSTAKGGGADSRIARFQMTDSAQRLKMQRLLMTKKFMTASVLLVFLEVFLLLLPAGVLCNNCQFLFYCNAIFVLFFALL